MNTEQRPAWDQPLGGAFVEVEPTRTFRAVVSTTRTVQPTGGGLVGKDRKRVIFVEAEHAEVLEYPDGSVQIQPDGTATYELDAKQRVR
jgi:hypothetical protein